MLRSPYTWSDILWLLGSGAERHALMTLVKRYISRFLKAKEVANSGYILDEAIDVFLECDCILLVSSDLIAFP